MNTFEMEELIKGWMRKYGVDCYFYVHHNTAWDKILEEKNWAGLCRTSSTKYDIAIHTRYVSMKFVCKSVLWHEYCHMEHCERYGKGGHGWKWFKLLMRKPLLAVGGFGTLLKPW